jgi:magnesium transporter
MLAAYSDRGVRTEHSIDTVDGTAPREVVWIDLLTPDADEIVVVEAATGVALPTLPELSEIESSSRLRVENGALYLSAPLVYRAESDQPMSTPVGFVLTQERLITVRFAELSSFATLAQHLVAADDTPLSGAGIFAALIEAIVDRVADSLERSAGELDNLSHRLFRAGSAAPLSRRPAAGGVRT